MLIAAAALLAAPASAQPPKVARIGFLISETVSGQASRVEALLAARAATTTIPIVVPSSGDPVAMGLVSGLARPGGNITGIAMYGQELSAKRMEVFKEAVPRITRVAVLLNSANPSKRLILEAREAVAKALKLELLPFEMRSPKEFGGAFAAMAEKRVDAIVVQADSLFRAHASEIAVLAAKQRLPSAGAIEFAQVGGLISVLLRADRVIE